ncbi:MAG: T9SS type A sorting domain-containing protein [Moheibacter sp.]
MSLKSKISLVFLFVFSSLLAQNRFHVTPDGSNTADGLSWANSISIERAFNLIYANENDEIWIKQGTYSITETLEITLFTDQVKIYGGFVGNETSLTQRDWENNLTVLDGNTTTQILSTYGKNVTIDGLIFQNGYFTSGTSSRLGGAISAGGDNVIINNCIFKSNYSETYGGAICASTWEKTIINNSTFEDNHSMNDGGAISITTSFSITNSKFINNSTQNDGGAIHSYSEEEGIISNSTFVGNTATLYGGAMWIDGNNTEINNCIFESNQSDISGGAIYAWEELIINNCIFDNNQSKDLGGAIYNSTFAAITNSKFMNNSTQGDGGAIYNLCFYEGGLFGLFIINSLFQQNDATRGGAIFNDTEISITNSTFIGNTNTALLHSDANTRSTTVYNSIFYQNTSIGAGYRADISPQYLESDQSDKDIRYNIVQEYDLGTYNMIGVDPKFVNNTSDFRLQTSSPAINVGNNNLYNAVSPVAIGASTDLAGNPRLYGTAIDYGAYELQEEMDIVDLDRPILNFYPNPVIDFLTISTKKNIEEISVFNTSGQKVLNSTNVRNGKIDVSSLPSGIYVFQVKMEDKKVETIKVIKK